ncbi:MAG: hypothetical protein EXS55_01635 [Candidatus Magasanikbacteria bacterium]|nr:hypothetical protein [Candidatus Magasanikbacteria bacterium]
MSDLPKPGEEVVGAEMHEDKNKIKKAIVDEAIAHVIDLLNSFNGMPSREVTFLKKLIAKAEIISEDILEMDERKIKDKLALELGRKHDVVLTREMHLLYIESLKSLLAQSEKKFLEMNEDLGNEGEAGSLRSKKRRIKKFLEFVPTGYDEALEPSVDIVQSEADYFIKGKQLGDDVYKVWRNFVTAVAFRNPDLIFDELKIIVTRFAGWKKKHFAELFRLIGEEKLAQKIEADDSLE